MKVYDIMLYLLIFNMMLSCLVQLDIFADSTLQPHDVSGYDDSWEGWEAYGEEAGIQPSEGLTIWAALAGVLKAVPMLLLAFLQATILLPWFLSSALNISLANPIILMFTALIWLVYAVGILQLWMRQSLEPMA